MLIRLLRQFLRPYKRQLSAVVALQCCVAAAVVYLPNLYAKIIDRGVSVGDIGYILKTGGLMLAISLAQVGCSVAATYFGAQAAMAYGRDLRGAIFHRVGEFSAHEVGKFGAPSLITRTTNDVQQIQTVVLMGCTMLVSAPIICIAALVMALHEDLSLSRLLLVSVPVLAGSLGGLIWRMVPQFKAMQPRIDTVNRVLREQIAGVRVVRAFVREPAEAARFDAANAELTATALRVGKLQVAMFPVVLLVFNASLVGVLFFGGHRVDEGGMQVGAVLAFISYLMQILVSIMMVTFISTQIPRAAVCAGRIAEVLGTVSSVAQPAAPVVPSGRRGLLELRDVEYRYPGAELPVLTGVSLTAQPGEVTAIVGSTGTGKTTLLELIPRLIDPTSGRVVIEGTDARDIELELLWSKVGVVPQRAFLFSGTVASNLRYGNPAATDDELWAALAVAQARDFVEAMPGKLDAPIAQGGTNVSGGQRQRLSIARALLRKPSIYLFDDSFSALDLATEARLRAALRPLVTGATVIMVAQRVASIVDADQIIVLDGGAIVGRGRHAELIETCPTYAEIVASQRAAEAA
ncbi:MAG TPA: ABC transporter ATP-binding protein [Kofleriaceae bacterium]|jgi:ATP-binding cassette subfamily B protein|nr:ABC transporter ATP-binding protein [Kofleriaceae bacterium]